MTTGSQHSLSSSPFLSLRHERVKTKDQSNLSVTIDCTSFSFSDHDRGKHVVLKDSIKLVYRISQEI